MGKVTFNFALCDKKLTNQRRECLWLVNFLSKIGGGKLSIHDKFAFLPQNDRKWEKWQKSIVILWFCAQWDLLWHRIQPGKLIISEFPFTYVHPHRSPPDYVVWLNRVVIVRLWIELERQKMVRCLWWPCRPSEVSHYWLLWTPIRLIEFNFIVLHLI